MACLAALGTYPCLMDISAFLRRGLIFGAVLGSGFAACLSAPAAEMVDVELILAVDVSLSMSPDELEIQRDGYAAALTHDRVIEAIQQGVHGRIAVTYVEWAGQTSQHIIVPWTIVSSREEAQAFVDKLTANPPNSARRTSISGALLFAGDLFAESSFRSVKRVVDISGDGANNQGPPVDAVRDGMIAQGVTINGLPLMTKGGMPSVFDIDDLDVYYTNCVIGGPGAFMIPVNNWSQFPEAIRRKLVLELAGTLPGEQALPFVKVATEAAYDCQIGEKMWRDRSWIWDNGEAHPPPHGEKEDVLRRQQLLPVDALLLRRAGIELAVAFREMRGGDEAAGDRHLDHRHRRLDQQMPGAVEPDLQIVAGRRAAHLLAEQPLDLAPRQADRVGDLDQRQRLGEVRLHQLDDVEHLGVLHAEPGAQRQALAVGRAAHAVGQHLLADAVDEVVVEIVADQLQHHVERGGAAGAGVDVLVDLEEVGEDVGLGNASEKPGRFSQWMAQRLLESSPAAAST